MFVRISTQKSRKRQFSTENIDFLRRLLSFLYILFMRNNGFSAYQIIIDILVFCISYGFVDCLVLITPHDCMGSHRSMHFPRLLMEFSTI